MLIEQIRRRLGGPIGARPHAVPVALLVWYGAFVAVMAVNPSDTSNWLLVNILPVGFVAILAATYRRFRLSSASYTMMALFLTLHTIGAHYTYAQVPLGFWMEHAFGFARNHYDRIGHFAQGFIPALLAREILIRTSPLRGSRWLPFVVVCFCLAFSALYELIEFWTALASGSAATDFLGTQGDPWDTQWDMQLALIGAITALVLLSRVQDRQLEGIARR